MPEPEQLKERIEAAIPEARAEVTDLAEPWRPHRTLACRYLWRSLDNEPT